MLVETTRFGEVELDDGRVITFPDGLLGFPEARRFALLQTTDDAVFYWLQSLDDPALAFIVCDPAAFVPDYQAPIRPDDLAGLGITHLSESQVLTIVNKVGGQLTANLLGPLVLGTTAMLGRQLVLSDKRYTTRHVLMDAPRPQEMSKTA